MRRGGLPRHAGRRRRHPVDARWQRFRDVATPHGMRSCWSSPIQGRTGIVGTFAVYHDHPHSPPLRERRLVDRFTHLASVAIDHAGLFGALAESEDRFRRAFEDNAVGMVLARVDGRMVRVNRALRDMLGRTEPELLGCALDEVARPTAGTAGQLERLARDRAEAACTTRRRPGTPTAARSTSPWQRRS